MKQLSETDLRKVFNLFKEMDEKYIRLVRSHHAVVTDGKYNREYITKHRAETKRKIQSLKDFYCGHALEVVQELREEYAEKPPAKTVYATTEEKTLQQLERNNNLLLWKAQLEGATVAEMRELYKEHTYNEDFLVLLRSELRKRKGEPEIKAFMVEMDAPAKTPLDRELDKLERSIKSFRSLDMYPEGLHIHGLKKVQFRQVDRDLDSFPIDGNPEFRPVFNLKDTKIA